MEYRFHFLHLAIIIIIHISQLFVYFSLFVYSIFENNYFFSSFVFCSIFLNYYVDLFCHCPISSPFCYMLKITHLTGCGPLGVHSIGHWAHSWVRSIEVERTRSALVKCKYAWYAKKIFYYDKEARGTQRKNVNLCGGWCGGCDENFKYFYPSACGGVNQPNIEGKNYEIINLKKHLIAKYMRSGYTIHTIFFMYMNQRSEGLLRSR